MAGIVDGAMLIGDDLKPGHCGLKQFVGSEQISRIERTPIPVGMAGRKRRIDQNAVRANGRDDFIEDRTIEIVGDDDAVEDFGRKWKAGICLQIGFHEGHVIAVGEIRDA